MTKKVQILKEIKNNKIACLHAFFVSKIYKKILNINVENL